jgi:hypothetical protein
MRIDDTREEYFRGADTDAARGGGASTDRGGRDAGMPGPSPEAAQREAESGRQGQGPPDDAGTGRDLDAPKTDPGPTS